MIDRRPELPGTPTLAMLLLYVILQVDRNGWFATAVDEDIAGCCADARARPGTRRAMRYRHVRSAMLCAVFSGPDTIGVRAAISISRWRRIRSRSFTAHYVMYSPPLTWKVWPVM